MRCQGTPLGTTSACAENTWRAAQRDHDAGNYLRVRGEYRLKAGVIEKIMELPPRARRILSDAFLLSSVVGTTSACAENTLAWPYFPGLPWNYLRVRGEYRQKTACTSTASELPPRARRILGLARFGVVNDGTTSACAENTLSPELAPINAANYLRVRGEY